MINFLKEQVSVLSILLWLFLSGLIFYRLRKRKVSLVFFITALVFFYLSSTSLLPQFLAKQLEKKFLPFDPHRLMAGHGKVYIHLLGSGYNLDERLPATSQLGIVAQGRLIETMRLYNSIDSSIIVCSGSAPEEGLLSQAAVAKKAAVLLGADSSRVITLDTPRTTKEEAEALAGKVGNQITLIIVTDAIHMPRAIKLFAKQGFNTLAAPSGFRVHEGKQGIAAKWWPQLENIFIMDRVLHEYAGSIKAAL